MFWPARSGLAFFFGLRCAAGMVAIVVLSFRARRSCANKNGQLMAGMCLGCFVYLGSNDQNGGSSLCCVAQGSEPCCERAPTAVGVPLAHGSSPTLPACGRAGPPWLLPLALRVTFAVA